MFSHILIPPFLPDGFQN